MKRWLLVVLAAILIVSAGAALRSHTKSEAKRKREAAYESTLGAYSQNLKPGLTRKEVEEYIGGKALPSNNVLR
jgi:hypothetical protein